MAIIVAASTTTPPMPSMKNPRSLPQRAGIRVMK
jgi:hypothetical protein